MKKKKSDPQDSYACPQFSKFVIPDGEGSTALPIAFNDER
jgi:hypothetical protein